MSKINEILTESEITFFMDFLGYGHPEKSEYWFIGNEERGKISSKLDDLKKAKPIYTNGRYFTLDPFDGHRVSTRFKGKDISDTWWKISEICDNCDISFFIKKRTGTNLSSVFLGELYPISLDGGYVDRDDMVNMDGFNERKDKLTELVRDAIGKKIVLYSSDFWKNNSALIFSKKNIKSFAFANENGKVLQTSIHFGTNSKGSKIILMPHLTTHFVDESIVLDSIISFFL